MKKTFILLLSVLTFFTACNDDDNKPTPVEKYVAGEVKSIADGTDNINSFLLKVETSTKKNYDATVNDTTQKSNFEKGQHIMLKGMAVENYLTVEKVITTNIDSFALNGVVKSIDSNDLGYSAMVTVDKEDYSALFLKETLGDKYETCAKGDTIDVSGSLGLINNIMQLKVKDIK
jgi:hypothetical protein